MAGQYGTMPDGTRAYRDDQGNYHALDANDNLIAGQAGPQPEQPKNWMQAAAVSAGKGTADIGHNMVDAASGFNRFFGAPGFDNTRPDDINRIMEPIKDEYPVLSAVSEAAPGLAFGGPRAAATRLATWPMEAAIGMATRDPDSSMLRGGIEGIVGREGFDMASRVAGRLWNSRNLKGGFDGDRANIPPGTVSGRVVTSSNVPEGLDLNDVMARQVLEAGGKLTPGSRGGAAAAYEATLGSGMWTKKFIDEVKDFNDLHYNRLLGKALGMTDERLGRLQRFDAHAKKEISDQLGEHFETVGKSMPGQRISGDMLHKVNNYVLDNKKTRAAFEDMGVNLPRVGKEVEGQDVVIDALNAGKMDSLNLTGPQFMAVRTAVSDSLAGAKKAGDSAQTGMFKKMLDTLDRQVNSSGMNPDMLKLWRDSQEKWALLQSLPRTKSEGGVNPGMLWKNASDKSELYLSDSNDIQNVLKMAQGMSSQSRVVPHNYSHSGDVLLNSDPKANILNILQRPGAKKWAESGYAAGFPGLLNRVTAAESTSPGMRRFMQRSGRVAGGVFTDETSDTDY